MRSHVKDRMDDYLMGTLSGTALRRFEEHVERCSFCAKALRDVEDARSYLQWLRPLESPPRPGPEFYFKVQQSIQKKQDAGWFASLVTALHTPRLAYPLLFLVLGLLFTAWTIEYESDLGDAGVFGIPATQYSVSISTDEDRVLGRELVMTSLVEVPEGE